MRKLTITLGLLLMAIPSFAQEQTEILTSIKPENARPATFRDQAHMDEKKDAKIEAIKQEILANQDDPERVNKLRQTLWRFENAVILETK